MSQQIIQPCEDLKDYISHFWAATWDEPIPLTNSTYYATANSLTELVFGFVGSEKLFSSIRGHTTNHIQFPAGGLQELFGVSLYSHAVPFLFHLPASELSNYFVSPETLLGDDGQFLTEKITLTSTTQERVHLLTQYFRSQLKRQRWGDPFISKAVRQIRQNNGNLNITDLSNDFCLSQKQFERRFKACAGFNPKLYARIVRFETILSNRTRFVNLTEAAHANGYYDQAHFIHDFKTFTGYSPNTFFALSGY